MSVRQYELVYILPPDSTEQQVAEVHDQVAAIVTRMGGAHRKNRELGPPQAGLRDWTPQGGLSTCSRSSTAPAS